MSIEMLAVIVTGSIVALTLAVVLFIKVPKRLNQKKYTKRWREIQGLCRDKSNWKDAIIHADKLMDRALKQRKFKGSRPGERLVSAQRKLTDNDGTWFAHNLYKKVLADDKFRLREEDVKRALVNFRQVLRDLGALPRGESSDKK